MKQIKLVFIGFGLIGKALAEKIIDKNKTLENQSGIKLKTVGIAEIDGCLVDEEGLDLQDCLSLANQGKLAKSKNWETTPSSCLSKSIN